jgi:hypothetical protein
LVSVLHGWNDLNIFLAREYFFMRSGVFPYTSEDEKAVATMIEKSGEKAKDRFEEYIK